MRIGSTQLLVFLAIGCVRIGAAGTVSYTSPPLANPEDVFTATATLASPGTLTLQTWGFGGGTNAAKTVIPAGGFDPLVAVFMGTGLSATFVEGTSDILSNYPPSAGCPPAGTVTIGSVAGNCGDVFMALSLSAGTYTVVLSDAAYIPNAVFSGAGTLDDGFFDLTGGAFQTCLADGSACIDDTANWALDVSVSGSSATPEPAAWGMAGLGLLGLAAVARLRSEVGNPWLKRKQEREGVQI
jgi:MYXO-CTERM domain-containing protein